MATIILSAAGAAVGASIGGSVLGIGAAVIGRAVGATVGRVIDDKLLGAGSRAVETGRIDRFRLTGASEGTPVTSVHGRVRLAGHVIWASRFRETASESGGGGKGGSRQPSVTQYSYSVSLAIALCEGVVTLIGRIWADGIEIASGGLTLNLYPGDEAQLPAPVIEAVEGAGSAPAYRGTAYVVMEDLDLGRFGNRVPQFTFEVMRTGADDPAAQIRAVSIGPGTGEYALATTPVHYEEALGRSRSANVNTVAGETDFEVSVTALGEELPECRAVSLEVAWFGSDLRADLCAIRPMVEQSAFDGVGMPWEVSGLTRTEAETVTQFDGRPVTGGTPSDAAVIQGIRRLAEAGQDVLLVPTLLMDAPAGADTPPWRGSIAVAEGADVAAAVSAFFGTATASEFNISGETVSYAGGDGASYRRFILHQAHLAAVSGSVPAFLIGSELVGLTRARAADGSYPAVEALRSLAAEVRGILGPEVRVGYGADWIEYHSHWPENAPGDLRFPLDTLWADPEIDFVGISNSMPVTDWRDRADHADAHWGAIYNPEYLRANIAGGEGVDWTYRTEEAEALQVRSPLVDPEFGEDWVYRWKDIRSWWSEPHHERVGGVRSVAPTAWVPGSKPIWFTRIGCPAIDKGTNGPDRGDGTSPCDTTGARDDLIQMQFLTVVAQHWNDPAENPVSEVYGGPMVDTDRLFVRGWDARPYPQFPAGVSVWRDGRDYARGHWLPGRVSSRSLASVVREVCAASGVTEIDVSGLYGVVRGVALDGGADARAALQPLLLAAGADVVERDGTLVFRTRTPRLIAEIDPEDLVWGGDAPAVTLNREPEADMAGRVQLSFLEADGDYEVRAVESRFPDADDRVVARSELPIVLTQGEGRALSERWLSEVRVARESVQFGLPPSSPLEAGDVVSLAGAADGARYRIDRIEDAGVRLAEAVRIDAGTFAVAADAESVVAKAPALAPLPVTAQVMDLPFIAGEEALVAPWVAAAAEPWPGDVAVYVGQGTAWKYETSLSRRAVIGETLTTLAPAHAGLWDRGQALDVRLIAGALSSIDEAALYSGGNAAIIQAPGGGPWEVFQFRDAVLTAPDTWALSMRLRGQQGTDALDPVSYPPGSRVIVVDEAFTQVSLRSTQRGLPREYRIGPAAKPVDHPSYVTISAVTDGLALRPYAPVHIRARRMEDGGIALSWVRRTRIDGDGWEALDVPLGESSEAYLVRVYVGNALRREVMVGTPGWAYPAADVIADGATGAVTIEVAQISDRFGAGLFGKVGIDD